MKDAGAQLCGRLQSLSSRIPGCFLEEALLQLMSRHWFGPEKVGPPVSSLPLFISSHSHAPLLSSYDSACGRRKPCKKQEVVLPTSSPSQTHRLPTPSDHRYNWLKQNTLPPPHPHVQMYAKTKKKKKKPHRNRMFAGTPMWSFQTLMPSWWNTGVSWELQQKHRRWLSARLPGLIIQWLFCLSVFPYANALLQFKSFSLRFFFWAKRLDNIVMRKQVFVPAT